MQGSSRVATGSSGQISCIVTCGCDRLTIPGVGQLAFTNGDGLFTGYNRIYKIGRATRRDATGSAGESSGIVTGSSNIVAVPGIWQLSFTNGDGLFTGYHRIYK